MEEEKVENFFDIEVLNPVVQEYESLVRALRDQIELYKTEHKSLKISIDTLIKENEELSVKLKYKYTENMYQVEESQDVKTNLVIDNLKEQIFLAVQEKNTAFELWQEAQKEIDYLEGNEEDAKEKNSEAIDEKQTSNPTEIEKFKLELSLQKEIFEIERQSLIQSIEKHSNDLEDSLSNHRKTLNQLEKSEKTNQDLEEKITILNNCRSQLENAVENCQKYINELKEREGSYNLTIVRLENQVKFHEDKEKQFTDEIKQLQTALADVINDASIKVKNEVDVIQDNFTKKLENLVNDMQKIQQQHQEKCSEVENLTTKCQILEQDLEAYKGGKLNDDYEQKILNLQVKLDTTIQKLVISERKNVQLSAEIDSLKLDMNSISSAYERDIQTRELNTKNLERRISILQEETSMTNKNFLKALSDCSLLTEQLHLLEKELNARKENDQILRKLWEELHLREEYKEEHIQKLEKHLKSQADLNTRWKEEIREITSTFQNHISKLSTKNKILVDKNKFLSNELILSKEKINKYVESVTGLNKQKK